MSKSLDNAFIESCSAARVCTHFSLPLFSVFLISTTPTLPGSGQNCNQQAYHRYWYPELHLREVFIMRFLALFPLACAIAGFVLSLLCLLAGDSPGYMEDYHVIAVSASSLPLRLHALTLQLNTSTLGHNLVQTAASSSSGSSQISSWISGISSTIQGDLNAIENNVADKLAQYLGIQQWYSLHLLDMCEGMYSPNATTPNAGYNVTSCTNRTAMCKSHHCHFHLSTS